MRKTSDLKKKAVKTFCFENILTKSLHIKDIKNKAGKIHAIALYKRGGIMFTDAIKFTSHIQDVTVISALHVAV